MKKSLKFPNLGEVGWWVEKLCVAQDSRPTINHHYRVCEPAISVQEESHHCHFVLSPSLDLSSLMTFVQ